MNHTSAMLTFDHGGAVRHDRAALSILPDLDALAASLPRDCAGIRLHGITGLDRMLSPTSPIGAIATSLLGATAMPVRAILFDKTPAANWALGWHQDRTIAVRQRIEVAGYGPWSIKAGMQHVEPPFRIIESLVTVRIHFDDVPADNAPLLIAVGSHRLGRIAEADVERIVAACGVATCLAERGDVWAYSTPILHASAASTRSAHRRVLQVDYAATPLEGGLDWLGI